MRRREVFTKFMVGAGTMILVPTALLACSKEENNNQDNNPNNGNPLVINMNDAKYSKLKNKGNYVVESGIIVIHLNVDTITPEGAFVALSAKCTHKGCTVSYSSSKNTLPCPCHGSVFKIDGSVINGPASAPLKKYKVTKEGDVLTIT